MDDLSGISPSQADEHVSSVERWMHKFQEGLFGLLFIASKDIHVAAWVAVLEMLIDLFQVRT
jgi:hypothetical protein